MSQYDYYESGDIIPCSEGEFIPGVKVTFTLEILCKEGQFFRYIDTVMPAAPQRDHSYVMAEDWGARSQPSQIFYDVTTQSYEVKFRDTLTNKSWQEIQDENIEPTWQKVEGAK